MPSERWWQTRTPASEAAARDRLRIEAEYKEARDIAEAKARDWHRRYDEVALLNIRYERALDAIINAPPGTDAFGLKAIANATLWPPRGGDPSAGDIHDIDGLNRKDKDG